MIRKFLQFAIPVAAFALAGGAAQAGPDTKAAAVTCPVMKAPVKNTKSAPKLMVNNQPVYFCCGGCSDEVKKDPAKYLTAGVKDPVTGKAFKVTKTTPKLEQNGGLYLFSTAKTESQFKANPAKYAGPKKG